VGKNISNSITHLHAKEVSNVLTWLRKNWPIIVGALLISSAIVLWLADRDVARTQYVAPDPVPSVTASAPSTTPIPSVSITPTPTPTPTSLADPKAGDKPVRVAVMRGEEYVVDPVSIGHATSFTATQVWSPVPGVAEWYQVDDYPKPGKSSTLNSVIAAHVAYSGEPDAFAQLEDVKVGDKVIVTYASKQTYTFTVIEIIVEDKEVIRSNQRVWGYQANKSRSTVLFTCDDQSGYRSDGHRRDNRAVIATIDE
jgi:LPXTG-site transpeptidase (sortase) family protein